MGQKTGDTSLDSYVLLDGSVPFSRLQLPPHRGWQLDNAILRPPLAFRIHAEISDLGFMRGTGDTTLHQVAISQRVMPSFSKLMGRGFGSYWVKGMKKGELVLCRPLDGSDDGPGGYEGKGTVQVKVTELVEHTHLPYSGHGLTLLSRLSLYYHFKLCLSHLE